MIFGLCEKEEVVFNSYEKLLRYQPLDQTEHADVNLRIIYVVCFCAVGSGASRLWML